MSLTKAIVGLIVIASFGIWVYAYSGLADRPKPDTLDDATFALAAEPVCETAMAELHALPNAEVATDHVDRANQIVNRNVVLANLIAQFDPLVTGSERDVAMINAWIDDWRLYLADRADFAERFALDGNERFYVSGSEDERLERRITRFANTNKMYSCATPDDVG